MKLGAEPKKVAILVSLLVVALVVYWMNSSDMPDEPSNARAATSSPAPSAQASPVRSAPGQPVRAVPGRGQRQLAEFRPSLRPRRGEERPDPTSIDPTLRTDLLAKLQGVGVEGARRSIFDFGQAPPPKPDPVKLAEAAKGPKAPSPIVPVDPEPVKAVEPAKPQAPPIPMKFFGYISPSGVPQKRAFFVDGEEIHVVHEGDVVKRRYKIVRIGVNSVVVEDTEFGSQQTLPLEEQQG